MSIYVRNSSVTDSTVAPAGHSQLYILVPTINTRHTSPWEEDAEAYRNTILDRIIERTGMKDLREHIVEERCITPQGWETNNIFMGATFNLSHTMDQMLYLRKRPNLREPHLRIIRQKTRTSRLRQRDSCGIVIITITSSTSSSYHKPSDREA